MTPFRTRVLYSESGVFQNISTNDIIANNLLYLSGDQSISGLKSFEQRPIVSGNAVLLSGDVDFSNFYTNNNPSGFITGIDTSSFITGIENLVYTTGNQSISGIKNFSERPTVNGTGVVLEGEVQNNTLISGVVYSAQINVKNNHGSTIYKGQPVYIKGANGGNILVGLASNTGESTSSKTLGLIVQDSLAQNAFGTVITDGILAGFNLSTANAGDPVWLGPTGGLIYGVTNKPYAPNHLVYLGVVTRAQNNGEMFVKVQNGYEIEELHNAEVTGAISGQFLMKKNGSWASQTLDISHVSGLQTLLDLKQDSGNYYLDTNPSGFITGVDTSNFYTNDNPSGYITGVDTSTLYPRSNPSGYITGYDTGLFYASSNPSGYVSSNVTNINGATALKNMMRITQSGYNSLGGNVATDTLYIIVG